MTSPLANKFDDLRLQKHEKNEDSKKLTTFCKGVTRLQMAVLAAKANNMKEFR